jgi:hypothetical protein
MLCEHVGQGHCLSASLVGIAQIGAVVVVLRRAAVPAYVEIVPRRDMSKRNQLAFGVRPLSGRRSARAQLTFVHHGWRMRFHQRSWQ